MVERVFIDGENKNQKVEFEVKWRGGLTFSYMKTLDHRIFMKEFISKIRGLGFKDIVGTSDEIEKGNFFGYQANLGVYESTNKIQDNEGFEKPNVRVADTYETRSAMLFTIEGSIEIEWEIKAYKPADLNKSFGRYELKVELVCRNGKEVEELVGNKKKKLIKGQWEFRNYFKYVDSVIPNHINKIPIVKKFNFLKQGFMDHLYHKKLGFEENHMENYLFPKFNEIVLKHFSDNSLK